MPLLVQLELVCGFCGVSGLLHFVLPAPLPEMKLTAAQAGYCATTGLPLLFKKAFELGARPQSVVICAAGAACYPGDRGPAIGQRNAEALEELLGKRTPLAASDLGGTGSRRLSLDHATGEVHVHSRRRERSLWRS